MIADDHKIFRAGLRNLLRSMRNVQFIGEAATGEQLIAGALQKNPDVILLDLVMPGMDGIMATRELRRLVPSCKVIALSAFGHERMIMETIDAGASGFLLKNSSNSEIEAAIRTVQQRRPYFCKEVIACVDDITLKYNGDYRDYLVFFTEREKEIIYLICAEYTSKEIARTLYLSIRTVEGHRTRIMYKMGVKSIAGVIVYAFEKGLYKSYK